MLKIVADMHTHTNVSHHAVSSLEEMIAGAKRAGHKAIAITNHAKDLTDGAHDWHFGIFRYIPRVIEGVYIIGGAEANIKIDGSIDIDEKSHANNLDYIIASIHDQTFKSTDKSIIENAYMQVLKNPFVNALGHIGTPRYEFEYENIISKCNEYKKIVEINCGSFKSRGSYSNCKQILNICKKHKVPIAISSDAHISYSVGDVSKGIELILESEFPQELIINKSLESLQEYFLNYRGFDLLNRE